MVREESGVRCLTYLFAFFVIFANALALYLYVDLFILNWGPGPRMSLMITLAVILIISIPAVLSYFFGRALAFYRRKRAEERYVICGELKPVTKEEFAKYPIEDLRWQRLVLPIGGGKYFRAHLARLPRGGGRRVWIDLVSLKRSVRVKFTKLALPV